MFCDGSPYPYSSTDMTSEDYSANAMASMIASCTPVGVQGMIILHFFLYLDLMKLKTTRTHVQDIYKTRAQDIYIDLLIYFLCWF